MHILISRTDAIGDVVLTLPLCGLIKSQLPACKVSFLGNTYTKDVIACSVNVDEFINYDSWAGLLDKDIVQDLQARDIDAVIHVFPNRRVAELAFKAGIKSRIGTTNRIFHWFNCNKLVRLSRKKSDLHESQLNIKLLKGIGIESDIPLSKVPVYYGIKTEVLDSLISQPLSSSKFNLIIHPKSSGSSMEWGLKRYSELIAMLDPEKFSIFITGSEKEKVFLSSWIEGHKNRVIDVAGKFSLSQFLSFIQSADGLLAASTGPAHLAAASGIYTLGLYPNQSSINAKRWSPVGKKASYIEASERDIDSITADIVFKKISSWTK